MVPSITEIQEAQSKSIVSLKKFEIIKGTILSSFGSWIYGS